MLISVVRAVGIASTGSNLHSGFTPNTSIGPDRIMALDLNLGQGTDLIAGRVSSPLRNIVYGNDAQYGANLVGNLVTMDSSLTARAVALAAVHNFGAITGSLALLDNTTTADGTPDVKYGNGFEATGVYSQDALSVSLGYRSTEATANTRCCSNQRHQDQGHDPGSQLQLRRGQAVRSICPG